MFSKHSSRDNAVLWRENSWWRPSPSAITQSPHLKMQIISWVVKGLGVSHCPSPHWAEGTLDFLSQVYTQMFCFPPEVGSLGKGRGQVVEQLDFGHSHSVWVSLGHCENTDRLVYGLTRKSSRGCTQNVATQKCTSFHSGNFLIQGLL